MLDGGTFEECRRTLCPKVLPCTFPECHRPDPIESTWINEIILLYQDCKACGVLPDSGGLLDQSADLMRWFRVIDGKVKLKHDEEQRLQLMRIGK